MSYNCEWIKGDGQQCHMWHPSTEMYCPDHQKKIDVIIALEREINEVVRKAREK